MAHAPSERSRLTGLARWCLRRRAMVIAVWVAVLAGAAAAAGMAGSSYSQDYAAAGTESGKAEALLAESFPERSGADGTVVWQTERGTVHADMVRERMSGALESVAGTPGVASVSGPYQERGDHQVSEDGRTAYATLTFDAPVDELDEERVERVVETAQRAATDDLRVELGGSAVGQTEEPRAQLAELVGLAAAGVVLFLAFGSLVATALPLVTAVVSVGTATAGIGLLSHVTTVADFAPVLGTLIGLGVGIDYALFVVSRHRGGLRAGLSVEESAARAMRVTGRAVVFAGATVCIALLGMLTLGLGFLNGVAIAASLTVMLTVAASLTLLPALMGVAGMRALSGRERGRLATEGPRPDTASGLSARWARFVERHPRALGAVAAVAIAVLALPALGLHLGTSDQGTGPSSSTSRQAYDMLADGFGPGTNGPLTLVGDLEGAHGADGAEARAAFERLPSTLRDTEGVAEVSGPERDAGGDIGVITVVPESSPQSEETSALVDELRETVSSRAGGEAAPEVYVGGVTASYDDFAGVVLGKLPLFVTVVVGLGSLLLLLAFRSIGIPLKAAAMNMAAVVASFGVVVAVFQWGWGSEPLGLGGAGPIEPFLPVIMVSVLFGLSMDYQVFLVGRMHEEWKATGDNRRAVRVGLAETGSVINSAAVIMIAVFGAFVLSGDRLIAMFGTALATAVALDAFVLRTLLVPALMYMLGRFNWWLPSWLERWLPRLTIEPSHTTQVIGSAAVLPNPLVTIQQHPPGSLMGLSESGSTVTPHGYRPHQEDQYPG